MLDRKPEDIWILSAVGMNQHSLPDVYQLQLRSAVRKLYVYLSPLCCSDVPHGASVVTSGTISKNRAELSSADRPVEGSEGGPRPAGGLRAQCRFLLNSCWSSVWISSNTLWCITSVWREKTSKTKWEARYLTWIRRWMFCRSCQGVRLIPFALKWSQKKSSVAEHLIQAAELEPKSCCDPDICGPDPAWPGWGPERNPHPPPVGGVELGAATRNFDKQKCFVKYFQTANERRVWIHAAWMLTAVLS